METVGGRIAALRGLRRWTQHHLASEVGLSQSVLSDIELEKTSPTWDVLNRLADALGFPVLALLPIDAGSLRAGTLPEVGRVLPGTPADDAFEGERRVWQELVRVKDQLLAEREATILALRGAQDG